MSSIFGSGCWVVITARFPPNLQSPQVLMLFPPAFSTGTMGDAHTEPFCVREAGLLTVFFHLAKHHHICTFAREGCVVRSLFCGSRITCLLACGVDVFTRLVLHPQSPFRRQLYILHCDTTIYLRTGTESRSAMCRLPRLECVSLRWHRDTRAPDT